MTLLKYIQFLLTINIISAQYTVGDQISTEHQELAFDICYGDYEDDQLSLSDFNDGNSVIWIRLAASW